MDTSVVGILVAIAVIGFGILVLQGQCVKIIPLEVVIRGVAPILGLLLGFSQLVRILKNYNKWKYEPRLQKGQPSLPPGNLGWPIIGEMLKFLKAFNKIGDPNSFIESYEVKYGKTGLYKTHLFMQPVIVATNLAMNKLILMDNGNLFSSGPPDTVKRTVGRKSFSCLADEDHRRLRRLSSPSVSSSEVLQSYIPEIESICLKELGSWVADKEIQFLPEVKRFTFNFIVKTFLSFEPGTETDKLNHSCQTIIKGIRAIPLNFPGTAFREAIMTRKSVVTTLQNVISERRAGKSKQPNDVLQVLLDTTDDRNDHLADDEIIDTIVTYLIAGHGTSSYTIMWVLIMLSKHEDVYTTLKAELREIQACKASGEPLTQNDYKKMTYLKKVINEVLRVVNISPMVFRKAKVDVLAGDYTIPKGWFVQAWSRPVHFDPDVWPEPTIFNPDRWNTVPKLGTFLSFGGGHRLCPGKDLALLQICIYLYHLLLKFRLEPIFPDTKVIYLPHPAPIDGFKVRIRLAD